MFANIVLDTYLLEREDFLVYEVPKNIEHLVVPGLLVLVPFGKTQKIGIVINTIKEYKSEKFEIKKIKSIILPDPVIKSESIEIALKISKHYYVSLYKCVKLFVPNFIWNQANGNKYITKYTFVKKTIVFSSNAKKQQNLYLDFINSGKTCFLLEEIKQLEAYSPSSLKALTEKGILTLEKEQIFREPLKNYNIERENMPILSDEQKKIAENILKDTEKIHLIRGVTGSGKTEIYIYIVNEMINRGKSVIILIPEINLTPQNITRFLRYFPTNVAVWHSQLSEGEKYDEWMKIKDGKVKIVIGSRSAIFTPVQNLGVIIIDEEHDSSYRQDTSPRYHTRKVSSFFAMAYNDLKVVLASATPSVEAYFSAKKKYIVLHELLNRYNDVPLPFVKIVDLTHSNKMDSLINHVLYLAISEALERKEQVMLLLNKRGIFKGLQCFDCGNVIQCNKCDIPYTIHDNNGLFMICHYCNTQKKIPVYCDKCRGVLMRGMGYGIQSLFKEISSRFPTARIERIDSDTMNKKDRYKKIYEDLFNQKIDILIGTQMIAKGLDIPNVSLVGVVFADIGLHVPDYRAQENIFQLMTQISGRAGRRDKVGNVIIQTLSPNNPAILFSRDHDYLSYFNYEIEERKKYFYPPFALLMKLVHVNNDELKGHNESTDLAKRLIDIFPSLIVLGPAPDLYYKINNNYHFQIIIKAKKKMELDMLIRYIPKNWKIIIDL